MQYILYLDFECLTNILLVFRVNMYPIQSHVYVCINLPQFREISKDFKRSNKNSDDSDLDWDKA